MKKYVQDFTVIANEKVNSDYFMLTLQQEAPLPEIRAGQFVEVRIDQAPDTFLRRPISIHDVDFVQHQLRLLVKINGTGTKHLSRISNGTPLNLVYPLGNGFTLTTGRALLIGGGCGLAPLYYLAKQLKQNGASITTIIGTRCQSMLFGLDQFQSLGDVLVTTEDGSCGEQGFVTQHSIFQQIETFNFLYSCGPEPMMKAIAKVARQHQIPCEVSLENMMACGIGACLCCVTETNSGHQCVCTQGPVFNINDLKNY
ncbi:MAG: dihydroorotate dehydrogenase electron transfer subunit [Bacteroidales bacterium]|nr:dihydroorotate dehydrogenase electron transfer subunit [Bacteroidales bacterium]